jgi:CRISPR-associated protein (TIGR02584 family)
MNENTEKTHVLFSVAGTTPAVITETLFGLWKGDEQTGRQPIAKGKIHILTTQEGAAEIDVLARREVKRFNELYDADWKISPHWIESEGYGIEVLTGRNGREISDLRTREDNELAANRIVDIVRHWTSQDNVVLHASLAGGRRTMGVFLAQAMTWFARREDNLYHVLVPKSYEIKKDWFFPDRNNIHEQKLVDFSEQPFVRMRGFFFSKLANEVINDLSYLQMIRLSSIAINDSLGDTPMIKIIVGDELRIIVEGIEFISLAENEIEAVGMYLFLCKHHNISNGGKEFSFRNHLAEHVENLKKIFRSYVGAVSRTEEGTIKLMNENSYEKRQLGFKTLLEQPVLNGNYEGDSATGLQWCSDEEQVFRKDAEQRNKDFNQVFSKKVDAAINDRIWPSASFRIHGCDQREGKRFVEIPRKKIAVIRARRIKDGSIDYSDNITDEVLGPIS